jgi:hypothetical protein
MNMEDEIVHLKGVIAGSTTAEVTLSKFMRALEKGIFKNVSLVTLKKKLPDSLTSEFEITGGID